MEDEFTGSDVRPPVLPVLSYVGHGEESHSKGLFMRVQLLTWVGSGGNGAQICAVTPKYPLNRSVALIPRESLAQLASRAEIFVCTQRQPRHWQAEVLIR